MYDSLMWYQDDGLEDSLDAVDSHKGSWQDYVNRCLLAVDNAVKKGPAAIEEIGPRLRDWAVDPRMLYEAWQELKAGGGVSPGPNGRTYADLDDTEVWALLRAISKAARAGKYQRHDSRAISFLKDPFNPKRGKRTIWLLDIEDRVVQRAILKVVQRLIEPHLGEGVFGSRPGLDRFHALAYAERNAYAGDRFVWLVEDLRDAFDRVPRGPMLDVLTTHIPSPPLVELIGQLVATSSKRGVQQGGPLSPMTLTAFLAHYLDNQWRKQFPDMLQVRYVDDLLTLCRTIGEATAAWDELKKMLQPTGMKLKGDSSSAVYDLRSGVPVTWLGFEIRYGEKELDVRIAEIAWSRLAARLELAHTAPDAPLRAIEIINGWIEQMGPCFPFVDRGETYDRVKTLAHEQAFDEIPTRSALTSRWRRRYEWYCSLRDSLAGNVAPPPATASDMLLTVTVDSDEDSAF